MGPWDGTGPRLRRRRVAGRAACRRRVRRVGGRSRGLVGPTDVLGYDGPSRERSNHRGRAFGRGSSLRRRPAELRGGRLALRRRAAGDLACGPRSSSAGEVSPWRPSLADGRLSGAGRRPRLEGGRGCYSPALQHSWSRREGRALEGKIARAATRSSPPRVHEA